MNITVFITAMCSIYSNVCRKNKALGDECGGESWLLSYWEKKGLNHTHYLLIKEQIADKERWQLALLIWKCKIDVAFRCLRLCNGVDVGVVTVSSLLYAWCLPGWGCAGRLLTDHRLNCVGEMMKIRCLYFNTSCWADCIIYIAKCIHNKQSPQSIVTMETLAAYRTFISPAWYSVAILAKYWSKHTAVIICCKSHNSFCHMIQEIYKLLGSASHSNIYLVLKALQPM